MEMTNNTSSINLNSIRVNNCHGNVDNPMVKSHFDDLENKLIDYIKSSSYVIGCVAWLTNTCILRELEKIKGVKIIVNKEEYLNSTMTKSNSFFFKVLRRTYDSVPDILLAKCDCCNVKIIDCLKLGTSIAPIFNKKINGSILTFGIVNNCSRLHHKFLIFFDANLKPLGVWTGSYNLSFNSNNSLENALFVTDLEVINEYIKEFSIVYSYSEAYDWEHGHLLVN